MKKVKVEKLSLESFSLFGFYSNLVNPDHEKLGVKPIEFFRDMVQLNLGTTIASLSTCRVEPRPFIIDTVECHDYTGEGILPLDNDVLVFVGPASNGVVEPEKIRVFQVPKGTMIALRPGVWHHAVFTANNNPVNALIVLPERTYANDCKVIELSEEEKIEIEF